MSGSGSRDRRDRDRRPSDRDRGDRMDRRDQQPDDEQQRRPGDIDLQESDSLTALKAILGKVAGLLSSLQLNQEESISLVEQLYGSVLAMDVKLAGETDDKRKNMVLAHIQNTAITRDGGKLTVAYPKPEDAKPAPAKVPAEAAPAAEAAAQAADAAPPAPPAEPVQPTLEQQPLAAEQKPARLEEASPEVPPVAVEAETPADE